MKFESQLVQIAPFLHSLARRTPGADADDLRQDLWVDFAERGLAAGEQPASHIRRRARCLAIDRCRSERRSPTFRARQIDGHIEPRDEDGVDCGLFVEWHGRGEAFWGALEFLPLQERNLIKDHYLRQVSWATLAASLGITVAAVRKRGERALRRLRERLRTHWRLRCFPAAVEAAIICQFHSVPF